jgi:phosphate transport system permease protein
MTLLNNKVSPQSRLGTQIAPLLKLLASDALFLGILRGLAAIAAAIMVLIAGFLLWEARPILTTVPLQRFWLDNSWSPTQAAYNLMPMVWGTLAVTLGAVVVATPLGVGSALFCQYYAPSVVAQIYRRLIELLAGIPSVVYGFWGLVVLVPLIQRWQPPGPSLLAGILVLAGMILPTIALTVVASLAEVPEDYWLGAAALGASPWARIAGVMLPAAQAGIWSGILLGTGRAIGETMAVLMVCGNVVQTPSSLFDPVRTLTANIALEMAYALSQHRAALFVSGLLLLGMVVALVAIAACIRRSLAHG